MYPASERWVPLGPAEIQIGGVTIDRANNVRFRDSSLVQGIKYDEDGDADSDAMDVGADVNLEFDIARETLERIATSLSEFVSQGTAPNEIIARISQVGSLDSEHASVVKVFQIVDGVPDATGYKTITFPSMKLRMQMDAPFANRTQRFIHVMGHAYKDDSGFFWHLGTRPGATP